MKKFLDDDFLLNNDMAKALYFNFAKEAPIIDYHCHIDPKEIANDKKYSNIFEMWLSGDHYKWRIMRSNGVPEYYITGAASDRDKFIKYAESLEKAVGNPIYHWSHLELKRYFDYHGVLKAETAMEVWEHCNKVIVDQEFSSKKIIESSNVKIICTTDDPVDSLEYHDKIAEDETLSFKVFPTFRPDKLFAVEKEGFLFYLEKMEAACNLKIRELADFKEAICKRLDYFHKKGCKISDHGFYELKYKDSPEEKVHDIFQKIINKKALQEDEVRIYQSWLLLLLGKEYRKRDWVMQLHVGAQRDNNSRMHRLLGPDTGFDCIGTSLDMNSLAAFLNKLDMTEDLPKTIIYSLDPNDNAKIGAIIGCFQGEGIKGKIQHGSAWWFNDHIKGMREQIISLANLGLLGNFIGMTTDSRSITSYIRHDYFRRILCDIIGTWAETGELPADKDYLGKIIERISCWNCADYMDFRVK